MEEHVQPAGGVSGWKTSVFHARTQSRWEAVPPLLQPRLASGVGEPYYLSITSGSLFIEMEHRHRHWMTCRCRNTIMPLRELVYRHWTVSR
jgi:hypothetical protein